MIKEQNISFTNNHHLVITRISKSNSHHLPPIHKSEHQSSKEMIPCDYFTGNIKSQGQKNFKNRDKITKLKFNGYDTLKQCSLKSLLGSSSDGSPETKQLGISIDTTFSVSNPSTKKKLFQKKLQELTQSEYLLQNKKNIVQKPLFFFNGNKLTKSINNSFEDNDVENWQQESNEEDIDTIVEYVSSQK